MADLLLSGPAGAGKSQIAAELARDDSGPVVLADFSSLLGSLSGASRDPATGRFPPRDVRLLPIVEYVRRAVITAATARELRVVATNSDGDPDRRAFLLGQLGDGATERVVDPGEAVVRARLAEPEGELSADCEQAIQRWYGRLR